MSRRSKASETPNSERRNLLLGGGIVGGAAMAMGAATPAQAQDARESLLDKWTRDKVARIGISLTNPPVRFKDENGKPAGQHIEVLELLMKDIGVEIEYVEVPWPQLFPGIATGKFEMVGNMATILPSRAIRGTFAGFPLHYSADIMYVREGLDEITEFSQVNDPKYTIAAAQGSSQEDTARKRFPDAKILSFPQPTDVANAVGTGRADASLAAGFTVKRAMEVFPQLRLLPGLISVDANTYFMPHNDFKLWAFVTNWIRYQATDDLLGRIWDKWAGAELREEFGIQSVKVGPNGEPLVVGA